MLEKISEPDVPEDDPFREDALDREPIAEHLTSLLSTFDDPFVLSLSSAYGTGKTVFVRMWRQKLENEGFVTLYYNAWENDFVDDPLVAFVDEISTRVEELEAATSGEWEERIEKVRDFANTVAWRTIPVGLKLLTAGLIQAEDFDERVLTEVVEGVSSEAIEQYRSTKKDLEEFRELLSSLVEDVREAEGENPIVVFVDELDRCRPDHAVLLLERIKHFFDAPGITFVLSMERDQLRHSVKAKYGQEMDARGYLHRFIDLDFSLPDPPPKKYAEVLYDHHDIPGNRRNVVGGIVCAFALFDLSLRQQQKYLLRYSVVARILQDRMRPSPVIQYFLAFMVGLRMADPSTYRGLLNRYDQAKEKIKNMLSGMRGEDLRTNIENPADAMEAATIFWYAEDRVEVGKKN
jgi:hypothetical protein